MEQQVSKKPYYMLPESPPHLDSQLHGGGVGEYGGGGAVHSNTLSAHNKPENISPTSSPPPLPSTLGAEIHPSMTFDVNQRASRKNWLVDLNSPEINQILMLDDAPVAEPVRRPFL
jgi:hypothetical protein